MRPKLKPQIQIVFLWIFLIALIILFINNLRKTQELEKKLNRIEKELYMKEVVFNRRQKEFDEQVKKNRKQIESLKRN